MRYLKSNNLKTSLLSLCFIVAFLFIAQPTHAQFWKRIFGGHKKEKRHVDKQDKTKDAHKLSDLLHHKDEHPTYPISIKKIRYRIDVLLPLDIDKNTQKGKRIHQKLPVGTTAAINYYEGIKMAANQLTGEGIKVDLFIHDINSATSSITQLIADSSFRSSDLLICFLSSDQLPALAKVAKKRNINLISALSPSDADIANNPYFIILQPTLASHIQKVVTFAKKKYGNSQNIFLYAHKMPVQNEAKLLFDQAFDNSSVKLIPIDSFLANQIHLKTVLDSNKTNVIYVNVLAHSEAEKILHQLSVYASKYKIAVIGMPTWRSIQGISKAKTFPNLDIYYSNPYYFDLSTEKGKAIAHLYKSEFGGRPSEMTFRGYETIYWMAHLMKDYGRIFNMHLNDVRMVPFTRYDVQATWTKKHKYKYLENKNLYIFHYFNGNSTVEN